MVYELLNTSGVGAGPFIRLMMFGKISTIITPIISAGKMLFFLIMGKPFACTLLLLRVEYSLLSQLNDVLSYSFKNQLSQIYNKPQESKNNCLPVLQLTYERFNQVLAGDDSNIMPIGHHDTKASG